MSRIGKKPIELVSRVQVTVEGNRVAMKGPKGDLSLALPAGISVRQEGQRILVECAAGIKNGGALHGVTRTLLANMAHGITTGYEKILQVIGVGYKIKVEGQKLTLQLGFSHPVVYDIPRGIKITPGKENTLAVSGADKQLVGEVAAEIRSFYPPEPYKGKGIRYKDEWVRRKAGKAVATTT
jgi:large subunit ribosomal protein L6